MRNSLILVFLCNNLTISGAINYNDPSGSDSNNGSSSSPWKTLSYAYSKATSSGNIIQVNADTYHNIVQNKLAVGVSFEGAGNGDISTYLVK
jgi:Protein of unknown function (DUF1565)